MPLDHLTLKALDPAEHTEAADGYRAVSSMADVARERIDRQITVAMRKANEGEAAMSTALAWCRGSRIRHEADAAMRTKVASVAVLALLISGCGVTGGASSSKESRSKMNLQEAADRADAILDETFAAIKPPVQWTHRYSMPGDCYVDRDRAVMTIISAERRGSFLGLLDRHWKGKGYKLVSTSPNGLAAHFVTQDGFQLEILIAPNGQAHLSVTTPCVEESDVAQPTSKPNGPDYSNQKLPEPNVKSTFWSSDAPL